MRLSRHLILAIFVGALCSPVSAAEVAVIVNAANTQKLTLAQIRNIYNDRVLTWQNGRRIKRYNLPVGDPAQAIFARRVLGLSGQQAALAESRRKTNNTLRNPARTKRGRLVASLVARQADAIGYVPAYLAEGRKGIRVVLLLREGKD